MHPGASSFPPPCPQIRSNAIERQPSERVGNRLPFTAAVIYTHRRPQLRRGAARAGAGVVDKGAIDEQLRRLVGRVIGAFAESGLERVEFDAELERAALDVLLELVEGEPIGDHDLAGLPCAWIGLVVLEVFCLRRIEADERRLVLPAEHVGDGRGELGARATARRAVHEG